MGRKIIIVVLTVAMMTTYANAVERLYFQGTDKDKNGNALELRGRLIKPEGSGPFPAVILLHECTGITMDMEGSFAEKLSSWGYVTLQVDSFTPRAIGDCCADFGIIPPNTRVLDAYDAKSYLSRLPYVDRNRIAIMGWGHGGATAICAISRANLDANTSTYKSSPANRIIDEKTFSSYSPFQAAVAFSPLCPAGFGDSTAPLLILTGELDTFTPPNLCIKNMPTGKPSVEIVLKVYPKAAHSFVNPNVNDSFLGHKIAYQPEAAADADVQLKSFLAKHLK